MSTDRWLCRLLSGLQPLQTLQADKRICYQSNASLLALYYVTGNYSHQARKRQETPHNPSKSHLVTAVHGGHTRLSLVSFFSLCTSCAWNTWESLGTGATFTVLCCRHSIHTHQQIKYNKSLLPKMYFDSWTYLSISSRNILRQHVWSKWSLEKEAGKWK